MPVLATATWLGLLSAGVAGLVVRPHRRLGTRVRPYTAVIRAELGHAADIAAPSQPRGLVSGGTLARLFGPPLVALGVRVTRNVAGADDATVELRLRRAGLHRVSADAYRLRVLGQAVAFTSAGVVLGALVGKSALWALVLGACGAVHGSIRPRGQLDRITTRRRERIRLELYTVNHLLAMHLRTGAGPMQAVQRIVDRGRGLVRDELDAVLASARSGVAEGDAFRRAAEVTPEPSAARTYRLFATGAERGADLATALRALSEDLRDARRDEVRASATKRRAAALVPTIAVLAPVMLLFVAAPLPSIVLGGR